MHRRIGLLKLLNRRSVEQSDRIHLVGEVFLTRVIERGSDSKRDKCDDHPPVAVSEMKHALEGAPTCLNTTTNSATDSNAEVKKIHFPALGGHNVLIFHTI